MLGVDIGTSSSKGVLVSLDGRLLATATREHAVRRPAAGHVEMDARLWWSEFVELARELTTPAVATVPIDVRAVGVSGMGPCTLVTDVDGEPLRPAILYGVDTRAGDQIARLTDRYGQPAIVERCGSTLTSQAVGPKVAWIADHEPDTFAAARRLFMPSSYLVWHLTGEYVLDHHSASQSVPLYDARANEWHEPTWRDLAGAIEPPRLAWSDAVVGTVTDAAAAETGLPTGIPVTAGTVDAWAEAISVDAHNPGDLMLMYGTTMFLISTVTKPVASPPLWGTVGAFAGTRNLAGGMATSGAITAWLRDVTGRDYAALTSAAVQSGPGAHGLVMLPYFAGERTPVEDPDARGVLAGLTVGHTAGDLYRAALEATALGVRHNVEAIAAAGAPIERVVAVGGGAAGDLWPQIVSDVTGLRQEVRTHTIGASLGSAYLAARAVAPADVPANVTVDIAAWNPVAGEVVPDPTLAYTYDRLYELYRDLYSTTREIAHTLADIQKADQE